MSARAPALALAPTAEARAASRLADFLRHLRERVRAPLTADTSVPDLHGWSVAHDTTFWAEFLAWSDAPFEGEPEPVLTEGDVETARFFPNVRLNYAECLLARRPDFPEDAFAVISAVEPADAEPVRLTRATLRAQVVALSAALHRRGIGPGDRVVALVRNVADTVVAALAVSALGAVWSSVSPDLGDEAVLSRFAPLSPALLFCHGELVYQGAVRPLGDRLRTLAAALPSLRAVIGLDAAVPGALRDGLPVETLATLLAEAPDAALAWPRLPFDHPLFVLFSSGTTGAPKCIIHGAGGTLLEHLKEHRLHSDIGPGDVVYFHTTCGWMMWNWLLSVLASGATIVLYDGAVSYPQNDALWRLVSRERVTVFGTGPTYLGFCRDAGLSPGRDPALDLSALRAIQSTGSILFDSQYDWVFEHVKPLAIQSISGGTDIIGCFVLGHPFAPLYRGESQGVSLAMDVRSDNGELVCGRAFPSRPVGFFNDPDGLRRHAAYFAQRPGLWTHGDFIELTPEGSARILGRSDGILNIRGTRIGPAEIYHILQDVPEVLAALAVSQNWPSEPGGVRLVLFVVLHGGAVLDRPLVFRLKRLLKDRASPVHVPAVVAQVADLPTTQSGKRSERAAQDTLDGRPLRNREALRNPECLDVLRTHPALQV